MTRSMLTDDEIMAEFEAKQKAAREASKSFDNLFFFLKEDGEKANVHPLMNIPQVVLTEIPYHEKFDRVSGKMVADNVCAAHFGQQCKLCQEARGDKKLAASPRVFLPVYVHSITRPDLVGKPVAVMVKGDDGVERPISGVRILKLKLGSTILDAFRAEYWEDEHRSITTADYTIARKGAGLDTSYTVIRKKNLLPIEGDIPNYSPERVVSDVAMYREPLAIEEAPKREPFLPEGYDDVEPAKVSSPTPQPAAMTVEQALDMAPVTDSQRTSIANLRKLLEKSDGEEPVSFSQAKALIHTLKAEYNALLDQD